MIELVLLHCAFLYQNNAYTAPSRYNTLILYKQAKCPALRQALFAIP